MRYRLGTFTPQLGSHMLEAALRSQRFEGPMTRALEEMLKLRLSRAPSRPPTDLLACLDASHADRPWVEAVHDRLASLASDGLEVRLLACEYEEGPSGFLTLAATAPRERVEVLRRDWMQAGFAAMREGDGPVRAWPRLFRQVCSNGSIVSIEALEPHHGVVGIGEAVGRFMAIGFYESAVEALRAMRATAAPDPREYMDELQRIRGLTSSMRIRILSAQEAIELEGDDSLYGLMNAITATARDVDDWRERLALEEFAGSLARLRRPVPHRSGGATLVPA